MPNLSAHIQTFSVFDQPFAGIDMVFDSLDGYTKEIIGGASAIYNLGRWTLTVGPDLDDSIELTKQDAFPIYDYTWNKRRQLRCKIKSQRSEDAAGWVMLNSGYWDSPNHGFGLIFLPTKIQGWSGDGADNETLDLFTGLTPYEEYTHQYEMLFYPGNGVYFYADGVLKGSLTTKLPSGTTDADRILEILMYNATNLEASALQFSRIQVSQDR